MRGAVLFFLSVLAFWAVGTLPLRAQTKPSPIYQKGMTAYNLGDYEKALEDFTAALDENPDSWNAYQQQGYCFYHLGRRNEMTAAFNESLRLHPNNTELKAFLAGLSNAPNPPTPVPSHPWKSAKARTRLTTPSTTPVPTHSTLSERAETSSWLKLSGDISYGALGDLTNAANYWNQELAKFSAPGNASVANWGFQFGLEGGLALDKNNALSVQTIFETGHGFQEHLNYSSPVTESINPQLFTFGVNYYRYFPANNGRFFLTAGVLFGEAIVDYYQDDPIETFQGPLVGNNLGFTLGAGQEWKMSSTVGFELAGRFRYLNISQLQNNYFVSSGGSGKAVLAVDSLGDIGLASPQAFGQGSLRYATMDFTGFDLGFSFNFYLF